MTWKEKTEQSSVIDTSDEDGEFFDNFGQSDDAAEKPAAPVAEVEEEAQEQEIEPQKDEQLAEDSADVKIPADEDVVAEKDAKDSEETGEEEPVFSQTALTSLGLTQEQARDQFRSPEALESFIRSLDANFLNTGRQQLQQQQYAQQQKMQQIELPQPGEEKPVRPSKFTMPSPPEGKEWDPGIVALFETVQAQQESKFAEYEQGLKSQQEFFDNLRAEQNRDAQDRYIQEVDNFVDGLDENWKPILGKGSGRELDPNGFHVNNRRRLDIVANELRAGMEALGIPAPSKKDLLTRALPLTFPDELVKATEKKVTQQLTKRKNQFTARPTSRARTQKTGTQKAADGAEKWFKEHGFDVSTSGEWDGVI